MTAEPCGITSDLIFHLNSLKWNWGHHLRMKTSNRASLTFSFSLFLYIWFQCCVYTRIFSSLRASSPFGDIVKSRRARGTREETRKWGAWELWHGKLFQLSFLSIYNPTDPIGFSSFSPKSFSFSERECAELLTILQPITSSSTTIQASSVSLYKERDISLIH